MDKTTATIVCLGLLVFSFLAFFLWRKGTPKANKRKGEIKGPFGMGMKVEDSEEGLLQQGVDLSEAQFKDKNKFTADDTARVKAQKLKAGSGNEFRFGTSSDKTPKS